MVKRANRHSYKSLLLVAFALIVMITCWESNRSNAAVISPTIPEESIRLRILANSDSAQDQAFGTCRGFVMLLLLVCRSGSLDRKRWMTQEP